MATGPRRGVPWGASHPLSAGPKRVFGAHPLAPCTYKRRRGAAHQGLPIANPSHAPRSTSTSLLRHLSRRAAAPTSPSPPRAWLRRSPARGDLHHQHHHNRRGAEIYLATSSSLAGSRRGHLHRGASSDWIAWIIHLLTTRYVRLWGLTDQPLHRQNAFVQFSRVKVLSPSCYLHLVDLDPCGLFRLLCRKIFVFYGTTPSNITPNSLL